MEQTMNKSSRAAMERAAFRDRAAYLHVTGIMPTHLRPAAREALQSASERSSSTTRCGTWLKAFELKPEVQEALEIERHPLVSMVQRLVDEGWVIQPSPGGRKRRPFGKVFLKRGEERHVVQQDGSLLLYWPE